MVAKIQELCPSAFRDGDGDKAQIVMDLIDMKSWKQVLAALENVEETEDVTTKRHKP